MKGLLLKDFYMMWKYCRMYLIIILVWGALMIFGGNPSIGVFLCMLMSLLPTTIQAYDEREKWSQYSAALPYTRNQIVAVKFILSFILSGTAIVFYAIIMIVNALFVKTEDPLSAGGIALLCSVSLLVCAFTTLCMPLIFKFGAEKGRFAYMIFGGLGGAAGAIFGTSLGGGEAEFLSADQTPLIICVILIALAALLYAISWGLSIAFYRKREF